MKDYPCKKCPGETALFYGMCTPCAKQEVRRLRELRKKHRRALARLVTACNKFSKAHSYISNGLEPPDNASVDPQDWAEFDAAIKEATP